MTQELNPGGAPEATAATAATAAPERRARPPVPPLSRDIQSAVAQALDDIRVLRAATDPEFAVLLFEALLTTLRSTTQDLASVLDQRTELARLLGEQNKTMQGQSPELLVRKRLAEREAARLSSLRNRAGGAALFLARKAPANVLDADSVTAVLDAAFKVLSANPASTSARRSGESTLKYLSRLVGHLWPVASHDDWATLVNHFRRLITLLPSREITIWLREIDQLSIASVGTDFWASVLRRLFADGTRVPLPPRLAESPTEQARLLAEGARQLHRRSGLLGGVQLNSDWLSLTEEPAWLVVLPVIDGPKAQASAEWRAFIGSPGGATTALGVAVERLVRDRAASVTAEQADNQAALARDLATARSQLKAAAAEITELRVSLLEARHATQTAASPSVASEVLEGIAELLNELSRSSGIPERLTSQADLLRRVVRLEVVLTARDVVSEVSPELFDIVGQPSTAPPLGTVIRPAWVVRPSGPEGDTQLVLRGAVLYE